MLRSNGGRGLKVLMFIHRQPCWPYLKNVVDPAVQQRRAKATSTWFLIRTISLLVRSTLDLAKIFVESRLRSPSLPSDPLAPSGKDFHHFRTLARKFLTFFLGAG